MNIKELETATGITRANIRYYEQEGLLSPARLDNGYRDYCQEDLETLLRIKLLRQLQFSLNEIRQLQQGELDFSAAMKQRSRQLGLESQGFATAQQVCWEMGQEVHTFAELPANIYLDRLTRSVPAVQTEELPQPHPWRRFFARSFDLGLAALAFVFFRYAILHTPLNTGNNTASSLLTSFVSWGLLLAVEPLWIHFWGTTPGKWVWGIQVEAYGGGKLGLGDAYRRTFGVFLAGNGLCIPIADIVCNILSYRKYVRGEELYWESNSVLRFRERGWVSPALYISGSVLQLPLIYLAILLSMLPPCHGNLSVSQFAKNFNSYRDYLGVNDGYYLDGNGAWVDRGETVVIRLQEPQNPEFFFELENGTIRGVSYTLELSQQTEPVWLTSVYGKLAYLALASARPGTHIGNIQEMMQTTDDWTADSDFNCQWRDVTMHYTVTSEGFDQSSSLGVLVPVEGQADNRVLVTFQLEIQS